MGYYGWSNLGDAAQTYALSRLLPERKIVCRFREDLKLKGIDPNYEWIINGFFHHDFTEKMKDTSWKFIPNEDCEDVLYAGIHVAKSTGAFAKCNKVVGARDSYTEKILRMDGVNVALSGCATCTLDRYDGPRSGELHIEGPDRSDKTQCLPYGTPWEKQWEWMLERMEQLRTAERVVTKRLHVVIPCLAFGTPVMIPWKSMHDISDNARLTALDDMGFEYDKFNEIDLTPFANRFKDFLYSNLGISPITPTEKECPRPI